MKKLAITLCPFAIFVAFSALLCAQDSTKYALKFQYPEGNFTTTIKTETDMTMNFAGQEIPTKQSQTQTLDLNVTNEGSDGGKKVATEFKRIEFTSETMGMKMSFDSDSEDDMKNSQLNPLAALVGAKITTFYDKDGKVLKVEGLDELWDKLSKDNPIFAAMKESLGNNAFTQSFDQAAARFPKHEVAVGESWKNELENNIPLFGKTKADSENTLKSVDEVDGKKIATIESQETFKTGEGKGIKMGSVTAIYKDMEIKGTGVSKLDIATGLIVSSTTEMKMEMKMEMGAAPGSDEKIEMDMKGTVKAEMNTVKK